MQNYNLIKEKIENIFKELKINGESIFLDDDDLNYIIHFNVRGRLKILNRINAVIYFHHADFSMNFFVLNIYNLDEEDNNMDTLDLYEIVNDANSELLDGSFVVRDNKHIFYKSSTSCGTDYINLDAHTLSLQINIFMDGLEKLFTIIKNKEQNNE